MINNRFNVVYHLLGLVFIFMERLYHISVIKNRESILKNGLRLNAGERSQRFKQTEKRIYLVDKIWKLNKLINSTMWNTHPDFKDGFDIFQIKENVKTFKDEKFEYGLYTTKEINKIELVATLKNKI